MRFRTNRVFDYFVLSGISLQKLEKLDRRDTHSSLMQIVFRPQILDRFPEQEYHRDYPLPAALPMFCFPFGISVKTAPAPPTYHVNVFTDTGGSRTYAFHFVYTESIPDHVLAALDEKYPYDPEFFNPPPSGRGLYWTRGISLVSSYPFFHHAREVLCELYHNVLHALSPLPLERQIQHLICEIPVPPQGWSTVQFFVGSRCISLSRPAVNEFPLADLDFRVLFRCLSLNHVVLLFHAFLCERKAIVVDLDYDSIQITSSEPLPPFPVEYEKLLGTLRQCAAIYEPLGTSDPLRYADEAFAPGYREGVLASPPPPVLPLHPLGYGLLRDLLAPPPASADEKCESQHWWEVPLPMPVVEAWNAATAPPSLSRQGSGPAGGHLQWPPPPTAGAAGGPTAGTTSASSASFFDFVPPDVSVKSALPPPPPYHAEPVLVGPAPTPSPPSTPTSAGLGGGWTPVSLSPPPAPLSVGRSEGGYGVRDMDGGSCSIVEATPRGPASASRSAPPPLSLSPVPSVAALAAGPAPSTGPRASAAPSSTSASIGTPNTPPSATPTSRFPPATGREAAAPTSISPSPSTASLSSVFSASTTGVTASALGLRPLEVGPPGCPTPPLKSPKGDGGFGKTAEGARPLPAPLMRTPTPPAVSTVHPQATPLNPYDLFGPVPPHLAATPPGGNFHLGRVRDAFLRALVSMLRNYRDFLIYPTPSNPNPKEIFRNAEFLQTAHKQNEVWWSLPPCPSATHFETLLFDECVDAKANRSKLTVTKRLTPFLTDPTWRLRHTLVVVPPYPISLFLVLVWQVRTARRSDCHHFSLVLSCLQTHLFGSARTDIRISKNGKLGSSNQQERQIGIFESARTANWDLRISKNGKLGSSNQQERQFGRFGSERQIGMV
ncbi:putative DENN domain-containing protein 4 [Paratrimastix pyriformis]|uniref:DENN domain-containing protein 4 n=1 Tax=Paratrimastix pyriformis TaxID=342808 RepID=A0ABQ8UFZ1_9EUKA|nr:putative DENN domain-containing protein 4 [Paratrimastix pyriformis]